jgi:N,N'-diacetylchitobiose transport system permease protein
MIAVQSRRRLHPRDIVLIAVFVLVSLAVLYPLLWMASYSLRPNTDLTSTAGLIPTHPTLDNYSRIWTEAPFFTFIRNSIEVGVGSVALTLVFATPAAYALSRFQFRVRGFLIVALLFTQVLPAVTLIVPLYLLIKQIGLYDSLIGLLLVYAGLNTPFITLLLRSFFAQIPQDMEEAAQVDGAGRVGAFFHIALPLSRPGLLAAGTIAFLGVWEEFVLVLTLCPNNQTIPVGLQYFNTEYGTDYGGLMAASVVACVPALALFLLLGRFIIRGIASGGVKG